VQCKFSAQKSFRRECRAKYRRNIRRRSSKVVPKGMQSLCVPVWACGCVSSAFSSFLHHIITSFRITSHHTSYCINDTRIEYEANLRQMLCQNKKVLRHEVSFGRYNFISLVTRTYLFLQSTDIFLYEAWIFFFTKHEKKGRCFFAEGSKTVCI
jgi:hypothetical protein